MVSDITTSLALLVYQVFYSVAKFDSLAANLVFLKIKFTLGDGVAWCLKHGMQRFGGR
jgi:hypothetical protein